MLSFKDIEKIMEEMVAEKINCYESGTFSVGGVNYNLKIILERRGKGK